MWILNFFQFWLRGLRLVCIAKNHCFFKQALIIYWNSILDCCKRQLFQILNLNSSDSLGNNFLKKILFKVAYKAREHAILNHKNGKFCTIFSLYENVDMKDWHMSIKRGTYFSRLTLQQNFRPFTVNFRHI